MLQAGSYYIARRHTWFRDALLKRELERDRRETVLQRAIVLDTFLKPLRDSQVRCVPRIRTKKENY